MVGSSVLLLSPLLLLLLGGVAPPAAGSVCVCDQQACPAVTCPPGRSPVKDDCNCCTVCGQAVGERCGGNHQLFGRCSEGLQCRRLPPKPGQPIGQATEGVCTRDGCTICQLVLGTCVCTDVDECPDISRDPTAFYSRRECEEVASRPPPTAAAADPPTAAAGSCDGVTCPPAAEGPAPTGCPVDSVMKLVPPARPDCCPPVVECLCDMESCAPRPKCGHGQVTLVAAGQRRPGHCCSVWTCKVNTAATAAPAEPCANVTCPAATACPPGSYRTAPEGCCPGECVCYPAPCLPASCPDNTRPRQLLEATGRPGACCPVYECENASCVHDGKVYQEGESWQLDQCTTCHCKNSVSFCDKMECPDLGSCPKATDPDQCCPHCLDGCLSESGVYHNNSDVWKEGECITCSCTEGELHCHIPYCKPTCRHPVRVPGLCCPVCNETECGDLECAHGYRMDSDGRRLCECLPDAGVRPSTLPTTRSPARCRDMTACKKRCKHGFRLDANGCKRCKCIHCRRLKNCSLTCPLAVNERGCRVCRCRPAGTYRTTPTPAPTPTPTPTATPTPTPTVHSLSCVTTEGEVHAPGASWNDGCRHCYCHEGTEMCSMIACPVPACEHPEIEPGRCCPSCPDEPLVASRHVNLTVCLSAAGGTYLEGQTWQLDTCTLCLCREGRVLCSHPVCPPAACLRPRRRPGDCCSTCPGGSPTGGSTERPIGGSSGGRACQVGPGPSWPDGAAWRSSACVSCRCLDGITRCYHEQCPKLSCERPVLSKGLCCPHCIEPADVDGCVYGNRTIGSGQSWQVDACKSCTCRAGQLSCVEKVCSGICRGSPPPGHCCPVCEEETAANSRRSFPFLNGTSKVAHRIRVPVSKTPAPTPQTEPEETEGAQSWLLWTVFVPVLVVALLAVIFAVCFVLVLRRRSLNQPLHVPAEEEKKPLNGGQTVEFIHLGGAVSPLPGRQPPEPSIGIIRHT